MFKNILVPLDGSELSEEALPVAKRLLEKSEAEATLFRASDPPKATLLRRRGLRRTVPLASMPGAFPQGLIPGESPSYAETKDQAVARLEHELLAYLHEAGQPLLETGRPIHAAVHFGEPAEEIVECAKRAGIDLIVMATHGRSGLLETLQGERSRGGHSQRRRARPRHPAARNAEGGPGVIRRLLVPHGGSERAEQTLPRRGSAT